MNNNSLLTRDEAENIIKISFKHFCIEAEKIKNKDSEYYFREIYPIYKDYIDKKNELDKQETIIEKDRRNRVLFFTFVAAIAILFLIYGLFKLSKEDPYSKYLGVWEPDKSQNGLYESLFSATVKKITISKDYIVVTTTIIGDGPRVMYRKENNKLFAGENWFEISQNDKLFFCVRDHSSNFDLLLKKVGSE